MEKIAILGAGSFGTSLAVVLSKNNHSIQLYTEEPDVYYLLALHRINRRYLPGYKLESNITPTTDLSETIKDADYIFVTVPFQNVREVMEAIKTKVDPKSVIVLTSKGMIGEGLSVSELTTKIVPNNHVCGLYGITFAELIAGGSGFSSMCIASNNKPIASDVAELFLKKNQGNFRIYVSDDLKGAEFGGAMKNVYAIAMGLFDGYLEFVQSKEREKTPKVGATPKIYLSRHSLLNLCILEFIELGVAHKVKLYTLLGPSGVGDIVACANDSSRNYKYGKWNASLEFKDEAQVEPALPLHEGYDAVKSAKNIADRYERETPILHAVYDILYNKTDIQKRIRSTIPPLLIKLAKKIESDEENYIENKIRESLCKPIPIPIPNKITEGTNSYIIAVQKSQLE